MAQLIANPEGQLMPMNTVQGGFEEVWAYCSAGHRRDGINYPTPDGGCTWCVYQAAGMQLPATGLPAVDGDPQATAMGRAARESQPAAPQGVSPLFG